MRAEGEVLVMAKSKKSFVTCAKCGKVDQTVKGYMMIHIGTSITMRCPSCCVDDGTGLARMCRDCCPTGHETR